MGIFALLVAVYSAHPAICQNAATTVPVIHHQAELLVQQGRLEEAKTELDSELKEHPTNVEALNLLGIVESREGKLPEALETLRHALRVAPNSTRTHINLGNIYVAQKQLTLAEKEFRDALRIQPNDTEGNYDLGVLLLAKGAAPEAIRHLERVRPKTPASELNLVQAYFQSKHGSEALRIARELSAQHPENIQVHFSLGLLLAGRKQFKLAEEELEKADALQPGTFEILYNIGLAYLREGDLSKAELVSRRALKLNPDSPDALYLAAQVDAKQQRPLDALDLLVRAHKIDPDNVDISFLMAEISISQNYFEDAIPLLESAQSLAPARTDLRAALGESYFMAGKVDQAIASFKKLIEVDPSARSYTFLGLSYRHLGRFDEAKGYFEKGLKLDPNNSGCLFNLGYISERQGDSKTAETLFEQILQMNPTYPDALLELANLRIAGKRFQEAEDLLRRFVNVSSDPSTGYYKLAMVERSLHETEAAERDLHVFQTLSKNAATGPYPYEHLFEYLDSRAKLDAGKRAQLDLDELTQEIKKHPDQPEDLYLLSEAYLKAGKIDEARSTIEKLDALTTGDFRTLGGVGVLLARHHLYDDAIQHFQAALRANPNSNEVQFDLADAYFRKGMYPQALDAMQHITGDGGKDESYLALLGDIYNHLGDSKGAVAIYQSALERNPDSDQDYLALALIYFRLNDVPAAKKILLQGQARVPGSGKILWGLGIAAVMDGDTKQATQLFERAVDLLPEWPGSYSTLGVFYYQTGQIAKAREVLHRFKDSNAGGLDVNRIQAALDRAQDGDHTSEQAMTADGQKQLLQLALTLADRTL